MVAGRSYAADLKTELDSQSWSNLGVGSGVVPIKIGPKKAEKGNLGVIIYEGPEDTEEYKTFAGGSPVVRPQSGKVKIWHRNNDNRQNMIDDIEAILESNDATWHWRIEEVTRLDERNRYDAEIQIVRILK